MSAMASWITSLTIVYSSVYSGADQKKTPKLRVTGLREGNSSVTGELPAQRSSYTENVSTWWRHCVLLQITIPYIVVLKAFIWITCTLNGGPLGPKSKLHHFTKIMFSPRPYQHHLNNTYRKRSNISRTKSTNVIVSRLVLQWSLLNPMKPGGKSRMKM